MADGKSIERDVGRIEGRQDSVEDRLDRIETKVDDLVKSMSVAKGGMKMLISVGTIAATIGAGVGELLHYFHGSH